MSILTNRPDNKRRPTDWRWQRANELAEGARLVRGRDDEVVQFASKFKRLLSRCNDDEDLLRVLDAQPEMYEAHEIYAADETPVAIRWELEARMLARETPESIERKTGVSPLVQDLYGRVFFDVADRLHSESLITHVVIGSSVQTGLAEREYDCLWKIFGYWLGPSVLDAFVYKFNCPKHTENHGQLRSTLREFTKDQVEQKAAVTLLTMRASWQNQEKIINMWQNLLAMEVQAGQTGAGSEVLVQNVAVMMEGFGGLLHKHIPDVHEGPVGLIADVEASGVRLRAAELAQIGMGEKPTGLEHLMNAKYPDEDKK